MCRVLHLPHNVVVSRLDQESENSVIAGNSCDICVVSSEGKRATSRRDAGNEFRSPHQFVTLPGIKQSILRPTMGMGTCSVRTA